MSFQLLSLAAAILGLYYSSPSPSPYSSPLFFPGAHAQYPPPANATTVLASPHNPNISISYKTPPEGTCATIFASQRQFTGYITLPPNTLAPQGINQNYTINTFFWFVEARENPDTAPLTVWMNGGPGSSSLIGFFSENGPCEVVIGADGTYETRPRLWGWDRSSNVLYIDQPVQVGLSYDTLTNASLDLLRGEFAIPPKQYVGSAPAYTYLNGTFASQAAYATANTSAIAARAIWNFLQTFLGAFPEYNPGIRPGDNSTTLPTGVNLFTESYGGIYGPVFAEHFEQQNNLRRIGQLPQSTLEIELATLGIVNGLVDFRIQVPFFPRFANNNTYGIEAIDDGDVRNAMREMHAPNGCIDQLDQCRMLQDTQDVGGDGDVPLVNNVCSTAFLSCAVYQNMLSPSGRSVYDIRAQDPDPFPSSAYVEYLNTAEVQRAIGAPVNYTSTNPVLDAFVSTGDHLRGQGVPALARLLAGGTRVSFIYGDADFVCNWPGGEAVSLAVASAMPSYAMPFPSAGYASVVINETYVGGAVRQFGNLSFVRIYDAGHLVPAYQPETAFTVFTRVVMGTAVATGEDVDLSTYGTRGPGVSTRQNTAPEGDEEPVCWIRALRETCSAQQRTRILAGEGVVVNGVWVARLEDYDGPVSSSVTSEPGTSSSATSLSSRTSSRAASGTSSVESVPVTGVYTATGTPSPVPSGAGTVPRRWVGGVVCWVWAMILLGGMMI